MRRKFQKDAFDSGEAFGEVCKKSRGSEEGEAEEACKVDFESDLRRKLVKISGRAKVAARDVKVPGSVEV